MKRLITIVTVCFNEAERIRNTIESVLNCANEKVEYLIIDGGSQDSTIQIMKSYEAQFARKKIRYRWISEPDTGIYNAMNKAVKRAEGKYILNINIGDEVLEIPYKELEEKMDEEYVAISFPVRVSEENVFFPRVSRELRKHNTLHHQGTFYMNGQVPLYNEDYKVFGDLDLNQRLYKDNKKIAICKYPIVASHRNDGVSNDGKAKEEFFSIVYKNFGIMSVCASKVYFLKRGILLRTKKKRVE